MLLYLLKINVALMILYGFYRLSVSRDTFFSLRRLTLWLIYLVAVLTPSLNMSYWVRESPTMTDMATVYADAFYPAPVFTVEASSSLTWIDVLQGIYLAGVAILSLRFLWQLLCICWLACHSRKEKIEDVTVHRLKGEGNPFSFFKWIFIGEKASGHNHQSLTPEELHEILVHERTHAGQYHSLDCIVAELFAIVCWFNPFAWLLRQEVRINLEFLADESVLAEGNARKSYQYHLLGLAYRKPVHSTEIANNFNLLPLKTRIKMMNKRRTQEIGKAKYLLFVPLAAVLLAVSNIETVAREMSEYIPEIKTLSETVDKTMNAEVVATAPVAQTSELVAPSEEEINEEFAAAETAVVASDSTKVYDVVEEMPIFPGGTAAMMNYLLTHVQYPQSARAAGIQGRVIVSFVVSETGKVGNAKIMRSIDPALDAEAIRVVNSMPDWTPGKTNGKAVTVKYIVPVIFRLSGDAPAVKKMTTTEGIGGEDFLNSYYPGGKDAFMRFFATNIKYPANAAKGGVENMEILARFAVNADGTISFAKDLAATSTVLDKIKVVGSKTAADKSVDNQTVKSLLEQEVNRVLAKMPQWKAGTKAVNVFLPVSFTLQ